MVLVELGAEVAADGVEAGLALLRLDGVQAEALGDEIEILLQMLFAPDHADKFAVPVGGCFVESRLWFICCM